QLGIFGAGAGGRGGGRKLAPSSEAVEFPIAGEGLDHFLIAGVLRRNDLEKVVRKLSRRSLQGLIEELVGGDMAGDFRPFGMDVPRIDKAVGERLDRVEGELGRADFDFGALGRVGAGVAPLRVPGGELEKLGREAVLVDTLNEAGESTESLAVP